MATQKQLDYIKELLFQKRMSFWRKADGIKATTRDLSAHENRHDAAALAAADLMTLVYETITVPADLTDKQASAWIDALRNAGNQLVETALDRPQTAERIGLSALIEERRAEIERAL